MSVDKIKLYKITGGDDVTGRRWVKKNGAIILVPLLMSGRPGNVCLHPPRRREEERYQHGTRFF